MGSAFETLTKMQAAAWDSAPFENVAENTADINEHLLGRLGVHPGERLLDIATGTGAVALRAARRGARVTAEYGERAPPLYSLHTSTTAPVAGDGRGG